MPGLEDHPEISLDLLNDDCLEHIFSFLPSIVEKANLEYVSKRWQKVSHNSLKSLGFLDLTRKALRDCGLRKKQVNRLDPRFVVKILRVCGWNLRRISTDNRHISKIIIENAGKYCPNLEYVEIAGCKWTLLNANQSLGACHTLVIKLFTNDEPLPRILSMFTQLRCLEIHAVPHQGCMTNGFGSLPETIEELRFFHVDIYTPLFLLAIKRLPNLRVIELDSTSRMDAQFFRTVSSLEKLMTLKVQGSSIGLSSFYARYLPHDWIPLRDSIELISNMRNLEVFTLTPQSKDYHDEGFPIYHTDCHITNEFLARITDGCPKLRYLDISGSKEVTDRGMNVLAACANLETLIINGILNVTGTCFVHFTNLKVLECVGCEGIVDVNVISLLRNSRRLEVLDLSKTSITIASLAAAREIGARENGRPLNVAVDFMICRRFQLHYGELSSRFLNVIDKERVLRETLKRKFQAHMRSSRRRNCSNRNYRSRPNDSVDTRRFSSQHLFFIISVFFLQVFQVRHHFTELIFSAIDNLLDWVRFNSSD